jgi:copper chaperone CopZ
MTTTAALSTELSITGMSCGHCVGHVQEALAGLPGVRAEVDLAAGTATVRHPVAVPVAELLEAVAEAGYDAGVRAEAHAAVHGEVHAAVREL